MKAFLDKAEDAGRHVFAIEEIGEAFPGESRRSLNGSLRRMVAAGLLHRAARGIYFNDNPRKRDPWLAERIAQALRPGHYTYISLSQALSEWSIMSQVVVAITLMTTGRSGRYNVPLYHPKVPTLDNPEMRRNRCYILFTNTAQSPQDIHASILEGYHVLPFAEPEQALRDFLQSRPSWRIKLDMETYDDVVAERQEYREWLAKSATGRTT